WIRHEDFITRWSIRSPRLTIPNSRCILPSVYQFFAGFNGPEVVIMTPGIRNLTFRNSFHVVDVKNAVVTQHGNLIRFVFLFHVEELPENYQVRPGALFDRTSKCFHLVEG